MALRSFGLAAAAGFACSLGRSSKPNNNNNIALCDSKTDDNLTAGTKKSLTAMNEDTCKCVVIGGGFAGSKAAYYLDSMFDVTLIDEKNFYEMSYAVTPLLTQQWNEKEGDPMNSVSEFKKISAVHRYYLKRANVVTGTAEKVTENEVVLADGRRVPYDLLILATGGRKPFPFHSTQRTLAGRIDEVKQFNSFLRNKCKKIGIIGGGPAGVALAASLIEQQPDKEVVMFHSHDELLPKMPKSVRKAALESLNTLRGSTQTRKRIFSQYSPEEFKIAEEEAKKGSFTLLMNHRVCDMKASPNKTATIVAPESSSSSEENTSGKKGFLGGLFGGGSSSKIQTFTNVPMKFRIIADELDNSGGETEVAQQKLLESRSIVHRLWFGDAVPTKSIYGEAIRNQNVKRQSAQQGFAEFEGDDIAAADEMKQKTSSSASSEINPFQKYEMTKDYKSKISSIKREGIVFDDFDYVFDMRGTVPRPIMCMNDSSMKKLTSGGNNLSDTEHILNSHILPSGKYRCSTLLQLLGCPNIFAVGKCNNLPWVNTNAMSDTQVKTLFGMFMGILFADPAAPKMLTSADGLQPSNMDAAKVMIPLGNFEAAGYSSLLGPVTGARAIIEMRSDREHLMKEFLQPIFFKQRNQAESKHRIMCWLNEEITDVTDFSF